MTKVYDYDVIALSNWQYNFSFTHTPPPIKQYTLLLLEQMIAHLSTHYIIFWLL